MPYLNVDDGMDEHPKIEFLSDAAFRLHMRAMLYAARRQTDGWLPLGKVRVLRPHDGDAVAAELVEAGVWHDLGAGCDDRGCVDAGTCHGEGRRGHYLLHDWLEWNHSRVWWEKRRADQAERQRRAREKREKSQGVSRVTDA